MTEQFEQITELRARHGQPAGVRRLWTRDRARRRRRDPQLVLQQSRDVLEGKTSPASGVIARVRARFDIPDWGGAMPEKQGKHR